jgi:Ca-activated chloride channel family protein
LPRRVTAAIEIVQTLRDEDFCSLAAFGNQPVLLTRQPLRVGEHRQQLLSLCQRLNADLGGTEMQKALEHVMSVTPEGGDILMVTDGQAYFSDNDIRQFARHRRRLFTIGVGHSTSEKALRQLSEASGGFCELVNPNEDMASHVVSHFRRLRAPRIMPTYIFPGGVQRQNAPRTVFAGDTAILSARLHRLEKQTLQVNMAQADLRAEIVPAQGMLATLLPRLVAFYLLPTDNIKQAKEEAVHYQLVTEHTSMIAVLERDRRHSDADLPVIIDIPQMDVCASRVAPSPDCFSTSVRSDHGMLCIQRINNQSQPGVFGGPAQW